MIRTTRGSDKNDGRDSYQNVWGSSHSNTYHLSQSHILSRYFPLQSTRERSSSLRQHDRADSAVLPFPIPCREKMITTSAMPSPKASYGRRAKKHTRRQIRLGRDVSRINASFRGALQKATIRLANQRFRGLRPESRRRCH